MLDSKEAWSCGEMARGDENENEEARQAWSVEACDLTLHFVRVLYFTVFSDKLADWTTRTDSSSLASITVITIIVLIVALIVAPT